MLFQIALVSFAAFAIYKTWKQFSARKISKYWFSVAVLFWVVVAVVAIIPDATNILADYVGVGRGADLVVYTGLVALFYISHRLMLRQHQLSDELTELVRQIAIEQARVVAQPKTDGKVE